MLDTNYLYVLTLHIGSPNEAHHSILRILNEPIGFALHGGNDRHLGLRSLTLRNKHCDTFSGATFERRQCDTLSETGVTQSND